jgi:hypothetical protein
MIQGKMRRINCHTRPAAIILTADPNNPGSLVADCGTHVLGNLDPNDMRPVTKSFIGYNGDVMLQVVTHPDLSVYELPEDDPRRQEAEAVDRVRSKLLHDTLSFENNWSMYYDPVHQAFSNIYHNLGTILKRTDVKVGTVEDLKTFLNGRHLVFVGGGPSAGKNKKFLKDLIDDPGCVVIGAGSGLRLLNKWGMRPDLAYSFDPYDAQYTAVFADLTPEFIKDLPLFTNTGLNTDGFDKWIEHGGNLILNGGIQSMQMFSKIDDLTHIRDGHVGVSTGFLELCKEVNAASATLIGLDLCFEGNKQYADDLKHASYKEHNTHERVNGKKIRTRTTWILERDWLQIQIAKMDIPVYRWPNERQKSPELVPGIGISLPVEGALSEPPSGTVSRIHGQGVNRTLTYSRSDDSTYYEAALNKIIEYSEAFNKLDLHNLDINNIAYQHAVHPYHYTQEGQVMRGGRYNKELIEEMAGFHIRRLAHLVEKLVS